MVSNNYHFIQHRMFRNSSTTSRLQRLSRNFNSTSIKKVEISKTASTVGVVLNNQKALNSLDLDMINSLTNSLFNWNKEQPRMVSFKGAGPKAFCAGGDVVSLLKAK